MLMGWLQSRSVKSNFEVFLKEVIDWCKSITLGLDAIYNALFLPTYYSITSLPVEINMHHFTWGQKFKSQCPICCTNKTISYRYFSLASLFTHLLLPFHRTLIGFSLHAISHQLLTSYTLITQTIVLTNLCL